MRKELKKRENGKDYTRRIITFKLLALADAEGHWNNANIAGLTSSAQPFERSRSLNFYVCKNYEDVLPCMSPIRIPPSMRR